MDESVRKWDIYTYIKCGICIHIHTYTYIPWNVIEQYREWNLVIWENMQGPREAKSDSKRQILLPLICAIWKKEGS